MCDCIKELNKKLADKIPGAKNIFLRNMDLLSGRIYSEVEFTVPPKKRSEIVKILHSYCPICGTKYETKEG